VYDRLVAPGWNKNSGEVRYMLEEVLHGELGHLQSRGEGMYRISPRGLLFLEGLREQQSSQGFCAMWFGQEVYPLWIEAIEPAIRAAGYEPLRIDSKQHNGKIDDEIMASIRAARFVVSDFTGNRGGVYYEAGFAHGLGLPVIFMCREGDDLHFDVRQYNCIFWTPDRLQDAHERLKNRILATLGQGPLQLQ
jgi:nucleoside 2-deoxyribosyltransferase